MSAHIFHKLGKSEFLRKDARCILLKDGWDKNVQKDGAVTLSDIPKEARTWRCRGGFRSLGVAMTNKEDYVRNQGIATSLFELVRLDDDCVAVGIFIRGRTDDKSRLVAVMSDCVGLPLTPNGGDILVRMSGKDAIFLKEREV